MVLTWLLAAAVVLVVAWGIWTGRLPLPLPRSAWADLKRFFGPPWTDTVWHIFLVIVFAGIVITLAQFGIVGVILAFVVFTSLVSTTVRAWITDLWNRDFAHL